MDGLRPFATYSFKVSAVNAAGRSAASEASYNAMTLRAGELALFPASKGNSQRANIRRARIAIWVTLWNSVTVIVCTMLWTLSFLMEGEEERERRRMGEWDNLQHHLFSPARARACAGPQGRTRTARMNSGYLSIVPHLYFSYKNVTIISDTVAPSVITTVLSSNN